MNGYVVALLVFLVGSFCLWLGYMVGWCRGFDAARLSTSVWEG